MWSLPGVVTFSCIFNVMSSQFIAPTTINSTGSFYIASDDNNFAQYNQNYRTIICSSPYCHIVCDAASSCASLEVYATSPLTTLSIQCFQSTSCNQATINADNINSLSLECYYGAGSASTAACGYLKLYASNVSTISFYCTAYDCNNAYFQLGNGRNGVTVACDGSYACQYATFKASYIENSLTMSCFGSRACSGTNVYCPQNYSCDIDCTSTYSSSCENIRVHVPNKYPMFANKINLNCSTSTTTSCDQSRFYCDDASTITINSQLTYEPVSPSWICSDYSCCAIGIGSFTCSADIPCQIDCNIQPCINYNIDGTLASSLTIDCGFVGCEGAWIQCPVGDSAACNIQCPSTLSCESVYVETGVHQFELDCSGSYACQYLHLSLNSVAINYLNVSCHGSSNTYACQYMKISLNSAEVNHLNLNCSSSRSCRYLNIIASETSVINYLNIDCKGQLVCQTVTFSGTVAVNADINCIGGSSPCQSATFNINGNKTNVDVHCISSSSCYSAEINAANSDQLNVHCDYQSSCSGLVVYCPYHRVAACNIDCSPYENSCSEMDIVVEPTYIYNYLDIVCPPKTFETVTSCDNVDIFCSENRQSLLMWDSIHKKWSCGLDTGSLYCCPFLASP
eukprot:502103_1